MDKLSYEIFSILESKFLFSSPIENKRGKVRILSIDSSSYGGDDDHLLAAVSLVRLESSLRSSTNNPDARIVDFFDVAAGSGLGGVLAAMLFTRGPDGKPLFSAEESLRFLSDNRIRRLKSTQTSSYLRRMVRRRSRKGLIFRKMFDRALTLRDTLKPVLIPCYDLSTGAPFLFSRADAMETEAYDFDIGEICAATCADGRRPFEMTSVDGRTKIVALGGGVAMSNPTTAAITHVLNNKQEFPSAAGVGDLLVLSIGNGGSAKLANELHIAASAGADTVDQAVATAFGEHFMSDNYVRIQTDLAYKNIESTLFRGRRVSEQTNADKLEEIGGKLVEEQKRRRISSSVPPTRVMSPRTSSATTCTTSTSVTTSTDDSCC